MHDTPFFSIVIPTYNRAHLIRKTIESVLAQEDQDFEVIVVDDGSEDNTEEVVRGVGDERVHYFKKDNAERGAARNYGAIRAQGRYVNFLDSDDVLYSFHLGFEKRAIEGKLLYRIDSLRGDLNEQLLRGNLLSCNGVFLRKDTAVAFPFNDDRRLSGSEDWELWLRLASRYQIHYSNEVTSVIVNHEARSVLSGDESALLNCMNLTLKYLFEDPVFVETYGRYRKLVENEFLSYTALHLAQGGKPRRACKYLKDSILVRPLSVFSRRFLAIVRFIILNTLKSN